MAHEVAQLSGTVVQLVAAVSSHRPIILTEGGTLTVQPGDELAPLFSNFMGMVFAFDHDYRIRTLHLSLNRDLLAAIGRHNARLAALEGVASFVLHTKHIRVLEVRLSDRYPYDVRRRRRRIFEPGMTLISSQDSIFMLRTLVTIWRFKRLEKLKVTGVGLEGRVLSTVAVLRTIICDLRQTNYDYRLWENMPDIEYSYQ